MYNRSNIHIIGGCGVGKAHAIAALKLGHVVSVIVDTDTTAAASVYMNHTLTNSWDSIHEEYVWGTQSRPRIMSPQDYMEFDSTTPDLIIVSSPNNTHSDWLQKLAQKTYTPGDPLPRILIEKPALLQNIRSHPLRDRLYVGYEYLHHAAFPLPPTTIQHAWMGHPYTDHMSNRELFLDLMPHLLSTVLYSTPYLSMFTHVSVVLQPEPQVILMFGHNEVMRLTATRNYPDTDTRACLRLRHHHGSFQSILWQEDLFQRQITHVLNNGPYSLLTAKSLEFIEDVLAIAQLD